MLQASSRYVDTFVVASGRRSAHLLARHEELRSFLRYCDLPSTLYLGSPIAERFLLRCPGGPPELRPYRDVDASRLAISDTGHLSPFLESELLMPFLEPLVLRGIVLF